MIDSFYIFEKFLKDEIYFSNDNRLLLIEERGLASNLVPIVNELYDFISTLNLESYSFNPRNNTATYCILGGNYEFKYKYFLKNIKFDLYIEVNENNNEPSSEGSFCNMSEANFIDNSILINPYILYMFYDNKKKIDKNLFFKTSYHELTHIYTNYRMLMTNTYNSDSAANARRTMINIVSDKSLSEDKQLEEIARKSAYFASKFEIDGYLTSIYAFVETNKNVNKSNFENYLNDIDGYRILNELQRLILFYDEAFTENNTYIISEVSKILYQIYNGRFKENRVFKIMRDNLITKYNYALNKFYKLLYYALDKNNRLQSIYQEMYIPIKNDGIDYVNLIKEYTNKDGKQ